MGNDDFLCSSLVDTCADFPTDLVYFSYVLLSSLLKAEILMVWPCQPGKRDRFKISHEEDGRSFLKDW